ncbi:hypothetical protein ACN28S_36505 [Cystobacter fuscus]
MLDETRHALARELLDVRMLVSTVVWTVTLYCMMWVVPEPTTKALAAGMTLLLMGYLGLETMYGLMDGWARMADTAHHASTFEELRAAGEEFGRVLGEDSARAMVLAVATLGGHTLGQVLPRVKSLPGFKLAGKQWKAQGGAAVMGRVEVEETALATDEALAQAIVAVETVATSPQGPPGRGDVQDGDGQWDGEGSWGPLRANRHSPPGWQPAGGTERRPALAFATRQVGRGHSRPGQGGGHAPGGRHPGRERVGAHRLSQKERRAIDEALKNGEYWLARLLEREARGRFVHARVETQFRARLQFNPHGVDVVDPSSGGYKYEILSGTESNMARHGRRMAGEFFRMLTF